MKQLIRATLIFLFFTDLAWISPTLAAEGWKQEWEKTIQAAKREGEVAIYGTHNPMYRPLWDAFQKIYPGVKINFVPGKGSEQIGRAHV